MSKTDKAKGVFKIAILLIEVAGVTHQAWKWVTKKRPKRLPAPPTNDQTETPQGVQTAHEAQEATVADQQIFAGRPMEHTSWLKLADGGDWVLELLPDGTLVESTPRNYGDQWTGTWTVKDDTLVLIRGEVTQTFQPNRGPWQEYDGIEQPGGKHLKLFPAPNTVIDWVMHDLQMQTAQKPIVVGPRQAIVVKPSTPPPSGTIQTTARPGTRWGSRQRNT